MALSAFDRFKTQLCEDIATQLRDLGAGDVWISPDRDRVVLELERAGEGPLRIIAGLNEEEVGRPGWAAWVQLRIESADDDDRSVPLTTLAWRDAGVEAFVAEDLPVDMRGLNAVADFREGAYRGAVLDRLRDQFASAAGGVTSRQVGRFRPPQERLPSRALTRAPARAVAPSAPIEEDARDDVVDAEFEPVAPATTVRKKPAGRTVRLRQEEVEERIAGRIALDMHGELIDAEKRLRGAGLLSSIEASVGRVVAGLMISAALTLEWVLNREALGTLLGGGQGATYEAAAQSLAYAAVGPFLIGGIGALADKWIHRYVVALPLAAAWAIAISWVISSDESRLSAAQMLVPKGEIVQKRQEELDLAEVRLQLTQKHVEQLLQRLKASSTVKAEMEALGKTSGKQSGEQRKAIREAASDDKRKDAEALEAARTSVQKAGAEVASKKAAHRKAILEDPSRREAQRMMFAVVGLINFASAFGMSLAFGPFMRRRATAKEDAQEAYRLRAMARVLRENSAFQLSKAAAMLESAKNGVTQEMRREGREEGVVKAVLDRIEGEKIATRAAGRFAGIVSGRRWRFPALRRS